MPLRMRDRSLVGQTINCPECREPITLQQSPSGDVSACVAEDPESPSSVHRHQSSPATVGWCAAAALAVLVGAYVLWPSPADDQNSQAGQNVASNLVDGPKVDDHGRESETEDHRTLPDSWLTALHQLIEPAEKEPRSFPAGTLKPFDMPAEDRFSWQAALVMSSDPSGPSPRLDLPWNNPANDRFVRRRQDQFLNPFVAQAATDDRYPATHFVGVAGVGTDAATLPMTDARAGIFGIDLRTRFDDIGDGLSQTMLIAGVQKNLGSWAAGGEATVRGFTTEPYINGPDGFGTGQTDGMHVLMADGSVRFLSQKTSPRIIRRMAAMNDGLPLDPAIPGEPGQDDSDPADVAVAATSLNEPKPGQVENIQEPTGSPAPLNAAQILADIANPKELPIDVPLAEQVITYDTERALRQQIAKFDQQDPIPLKSLLGLIEEMAAVPIDFSELSPQDVPVLDDRVTLSVTETTIRGILKSIGEQTDLVFDPRPEGIFVQADNSKKTRAN